MALIVDAHCHVGIGYEYRQTAEELLHEMDHYEVDKAVICPVDREIAVDNRQGNDSVLAAAAEHADRFYAFATANPWYGTRAVDELRRALDAGARGVKLHPPLQGFLLSDELANPLLEVAEERGVPVFFHTGTPAFAQPTQLGEVALRFPRVSFIMGHMGSTDFKTDAIPAALAAPNIFLDTSWILPQLVTRAAALVGEHRLVFGSDSPLSTLGIELGCKQAATLSDAGRAALMGGNILRLLGENA